MSATLRCEQLTVDIDGARLLDGVSLAASPGEWVSVVGPNGAGKTTLLRAIAGLARVTGSVELDHDPVSELTTRDRALRIALVPQNPIVPPGMSVVDYVLLGRTAHIPLFGVEGAADIAVATQLLDQLELAAFTQRRLETLSGGELQRAILARALAQAAPLLLLDEPTTALDVGHQQDVLDLVDELRRLHGLTVISTMHDLTLAGQYADRLVMLAEGRVVASGDASDVLTEEHVATYYGARVRVVHDGDGGIAVLPVRHARQRVL